MPLDPLETSVLQTLLRKPFPNSRSASLFVARCKKKTMVPSWWRGVVASVVRRMNEVTLRRARSWMGDRLWATYARYVTSQLGQLSLASSGVAKSSASFGGGKGLNVTCAGWQVTRSHRHVNSSVAVWRLRSANRYRPIRVTLL